MLYRNIFGKNFPNMNTFFSKVCFLFALYAAFHLAEACKKTECDCAPLLPHFDYSTIHAGAVSPVSSGLLKLLIFADSVNYLAAAPRKTDFSIISSAWACDCGSSGFDGPKFRIQSLNVYADRDFNDTLPAGASLNPIFLQSGGDYIAPMTYPDLGPPDYHAAEAGVSPIELISFEKPESLASPFRFRIELVKMNGDTLTAETGDVYFQ